MKATRFLYIVILSTSLSVLLFASRSTISRAENALFTDIVAPYDWYRYQGNKEYGGDCWATNSNCGPAAVSMAIQYAKHEKVPLTEIRTWMGGGCRDGVDDDQIESALGHWGVNYNKITTISEIKNALQNSHPVIAIVQMGQLSPGEDFPNYVRIGLSDPAKNKNLYDNPGNHWLILKGLTDDENWVIAYDPDVFDTNEGYFYRGWLPKGKDRYYQTSEVGNALLSGQNNFEITDAPVPDNFSGVVRNGGVAVGGATMVFSDNRSRRASILSNANGQYAFSSFYPDDAIVAAIKGSLIGATKATSSQPQIIALQSSQNQIVLPQAGIVRVTFISTGSPGDQTGCSGKFGLSGGSAIFNDYLAFTGLNYDIPGTFAKGAQLVFYLSPSNFCSGPTFLSTDPTRSTVAHPTDTTWIISWEDWTDGDFNDLTVRVDLYPTLPPSLKSPTVNSIAKHREAFALAEDAPLPAVEYYFDHKYPADPDPASDPYAYAVTYSGFDSIESYFPYQPYQSYTGNNGTDFHVSAGSAIIPVADGTVEYVGSSSAYCPLKGVLVSENVVKVLHADGYTAEYWGLSSIDPAISPGISVTRGSGMVIGFTSMNQCTDQDGFHFVLRNPTGITVDPFGWNPQPDSHWYQVGDPWQTYNSGLGKDATSYPLWDVPPIVPQLVNNEVDSVVASASGLISVSIPAYTTDGPIKIVTDESSNLPNLGPQASYGAFAVNGYGYGDQLVVSLNNAVTINFKMPQNLVPVEDQPTLYFWNLESEAVNKWTPLDSQWDPQTNALQARSHQFGIFAVGGQPWKQVFLPIIVR